MDPNGWYMLVLDYSIKNADMACHMGFNFPKQGQNQARSGS
jgi:hypothetical protein